MSKKQVRNQKGKFFSMENLNNLLAIAISILALIYTIYANNTSFKRNINPYLDYKAEFNYTKNTDMEYIDSKLLPNIEILEKNNLESAFLIDSKYKIEKLEIGNENTELDNHIKKLSISDIDIKEGNIEYRYKFLLLKSYDEDYDIYLIGLKTEVDDNKKITFSPLIYSEEYILMLEKYDSNNPRRIGERKIAKQFKEIVRWYKDNLLN